MRDFDNFIVAVSYINLNLLIALNGMVNFWYFTHVCVKEAKIVKARDTLDAAFYC